MALPKNIRWGQKSFSGANTFILLQKLIIISVYKNNVQFINVMINVFINIVIVLFNMFKFNGNVLPVVDLWLWHPMVSPGDWILVSAVQCL